MDKGHITISQFNVEGVLNKKPLLLDFILNNNIDICLLNETWLREGNKFYIPNYNFITQHGYNGRGGVGILIRNDLKYTFVPTPFYDFLQSVACVIHTAIGNITILCTYAPPDSEIRHFRGITLRQLLNNIPKPVIISGDLNAHHVTFGCMSNNTRGNDIYDTLNQNDLCILNTGSPTTVGRPNYNPSAIDITCVSPSLAPLCDWKVHNDPMGSYHYPTITNLYTSVHKYTIGEPMEKYLYNKADWAKYYSESENLFNTFQIIPFDPLLSYNNFCDKITTLKDMCIPKLRRTSNCVIRNPVPWWDDECKKAVENSKNALNLYRTTSLYEDYIKYKKLDALKKKLLFEKKKSSWRNLCGSFNRYTPVSLIWNYIRKFKRIRIQNCSKNDEWIPKFLDKYAPMSPPEKEININSLEQLFNRNGNVNGNFLTQPFSWTEFQYTLKHRRDTTPGLDDIPYKLIKNLHITGQKCLLNIFNLLWDSQVIPASWKTQCIIPILKPEKPAHDHKSYRPISLSSCIGKIFEHILKCRLEHYVEYNNILPKEQYGFRRGRSAVESFVSLIEDIKKAFHSQSAVVCGFLDVEGAFDNVDPTILVNVLSELGIPGKLCRWIFNFLYERTMYVKFNNILHGPRKVYKGTMQGATISPLLYNLYTSQIEKYLNISNIRYLQFADDLLVYTVNRDINIGISNMNLAMAQLYRFYNIKLKLKISPDKSNAMIFCKKDFDYNSSILYNDVPLPWTNKQKFLGICLDQKLSFQSHIDKIIQSASRALDILRSLAGVHWGSDPQILSMLYKSIVRSHFDYSTLAYMNANLSVLRKLDILQNKALRIISGAMCSTPIVAMQSETCILPLHLRRLQIAEKFCLKMIAYQNDCVLKRILPHQALELPIGPYAELGQLVSGHLPEIMRIAIHINDMTKNVFKGKIPVYNYTYDSIINCNIIILKEKVKNQAELCCLIEDKNVYTIYTDGSKSEQGVTSAFYDPKNKITKCFQIDSKCSIFTAESYAVFRALNYITNVNEKNFLILSDSKSVLTAISSNIIPSDRNYLIYKIRHLVNDLNCNGKQVNFMWVPSHCGITGNEIADQATRNKVDEDHSSTLLVPFTDYHHTLKNDLKEIWFNYHKEITKTKGKWYSKIQSTPPAQPWYFRNKQVNSRSFITTINRMRFGHARVGTHLKRLKLVEEDQCEFCEEPENMEHIIFTCRKYGVQRLLLVAQLQKERKLDLLIPSTPDQESAHLQQLLTDPSNYKALFDFIKSTKEVI